LILALELQSQIQNGRPSPSPAKGKPEPSAAAPMLQSARADSFELTALQWLWPNRFALGKLGLLVGLPDEGKGQILADMAARVSCGADWPCGEGKAPLGNVVQLSAEDAPSDTVVPRLITPSPSASPQGTQSRSTGTGNIGISISGGLAMFMAIRQRP
jgi:AAA domain